MPDGEVRFSFLLKGSLGDGMEKIFTAFTGRESIAPCSFSPRFPLLPEVSAFLIDTENYFYFLKIKKKKSDTLPLDPPSSF